MEVTLDVTLLGSLSAHYAHLPELTRVSRYRSQRTATLFAFLATRAGVGQPREEIIERFWPESEIDAGRTSLRTALASLRKDFGASLHADRATIMLSARTDLQRFEAALRAARSARQAESERISQLAVAVEAYGGPLLPGFYDDWILRERDRLEAEYRAALSALSRWHAALKETDVALDYAQRAATVDSLSEEVRADLIRLLKQMGRTAEARREYEDLRRLLGEQPSDTVGALMDGIAPAAVDTVPKPSRTILLPISQGRFRGRRDTLAALVQRLGANRHDAEEPRLFTLFGPGGIGKTRLAIEAARRVAANGLMREIWFVALAAAATSEQVWEAILAAMELNRSPNVSVVTQISARLAQRGRSLLVLDNLEQVSLEAAAVAVDLIENVPGLTILTTSRRRLGAPGEELIEVGALRNDDAIGLLLDRARSVEPAFARCDAEDGAIPALAARLEGFPLAIELAAAWASVLSPAEMLVKLEHGLLALPERGTGAQRHRSLTATIDWSVALLGEHLRRAFFSLSVFQGGWDADAAQNVCGIERDALANLRDRSLVTVDTHNSGIRFGMHEALREYGKKALTRRERGVLIRRHTNYFADLAEHANNNQLKPEHANLRAAMEAANAEQRRRLGVALAPFWENQGYWREGVAALDQITADTGSPANDRDSAELLYVLGRLCYKLCEYEACRKHNEKALDIWRALGDDRGIARGCQALAQISFHYKTDFARSRELGHAALQHFTHARDDAGQVAALIGLGVIATAEGDYAAARELQKRSLEVADAAELAPERAITHWRLGLTATKLDQFEEAGNHLHQAVLLYQELQEPVNVAYVRAQQGSLAKRSGDLAAAWGYLESALPIFREIGEPWACALCLGNIARLALSAGDYHRAATHWQESLRLRLRLDDGVSLAAALDGIAAYLFCVAAATGQTNTALDAVRLRSAGAHLRSAIGLGPAEPEDLPEQEAQVRANIGIDACAAAEAEGAFLSQEEAGALALERLERDC